MNNDGHCGGVAEARIARADKKISVLMLMPGSGLGSAFVGRTACRSPARRFAAMETAHMIAPLHLLGLAGKPFPCGCGKDWGCVEAYTTISGLPRLLAENFEISRPRTRQIHRAGEGKSFVAPQPRAKGRCAGAGDF
jgi:glucokinase